MIVDTTLQWIRKAQVVIGKGSRGLIVEELRISFEVTKTIESEPNFAVVKIYNLNPTNEARIKNEFDEVLLNVGYRDSMRLVFRGTIKHVYRYREGNDRITEIEAGDGDKDFRTAIMNETLAAGTTDAQLVDRAVSSFTGGTSKGHVDITKRARLRGKVVSGNTRKVLNDLAHSNKSHWSIQDGRLQIVAATATLPNVAIQITAETGMLNAPEINDKGIAVTCLLNPALAINAKILLDNSDIKAKRESAEALASAEDREKTRPKVPVRLNPDGIYKVIKLTHTGDTHGEKWISEVECIGLGQPVPLSRGL